MPCRHQPFGNTTETSRCGTGTDSGSAVTALLVAVGTLQQERGHSKVALLKPTLYSKGGTVQALIVGLASRFMN